MFMSALTAVEPIDIRENNQAIDRVNMYASCESCSASNRPAAHVSLARRKGLVHCQVLAMSVNVGRVPTKCTKDASHHNLRTISHEDYTVYLMSVVAVRNGTQSVLLSLCRTPVLPAIHPAE